MKKLTKSLALTGAILPCLTSAAEPNRLQLPVPDTEPKTYSQLDVRDVKRPEQKNPLRHQRVHQTYLSS